MRTEVLLLGLIVGCANYLFRYFPLCLQRHHKTQERRGVVGILLDSIGIASICALLVVSTAPDVMQHSQHIIPAVVGFAVLGLSFYRLRSIIIPTLLSALSYGIALKLLMVM